MHLTGMNIRDTPPFTELVELDFDARVNVFIGPNASGKSVLLKQIDSAFNKGNAPETSRIYYPVEPEYAPRDTYNIGSSRRQIEEWSESPKWLADALNRNNLLFADESYHDSKVPVVYIGPIRTALPELYEEEFTENDEADVDIDEEVIAALTKPFSGANFKIANEKMIQKSDAMFAQQREDDTLEPRAHRIGEVIYTAYPCVKSICSEVITGEHTKNYVTGLNMEDLYLRLSPSFDEVNIHRSLGINTIDRPNFGSIRPDDRPSYSEEVGQAPLYVGFLSSGTQLTFLWVYWLALKMLHYYDFAEGWMRQPAILLIDEIENHLHPTWQRRVIPELLKCFPNLQIFATTHSPFVVAGLRSGQVHLLRRNSDGVVESSTNDHDIIGWTTDEILRSFMGVDEPTDELTIRRSHRLRELRGKESLTDEEREELETLRRQVNADLLSSRSPMERQRGRYADMMLRFIESRQSELSQDG